MASVKTPATAATDSEIVDIVSAVDWDFTDADTGLFTHNFHPYPAKFIPQIPAVLIESFTHTGDTVLDPFCGSGTTLVEAILRGRKAIGVDANPLATLIARVKCRPLSDDERRAVEAAKCEAEQAIGAFYMGDLSNCEATQLKLFHPAAPKVEPAIPDIPKLHFWFPIEAINELALLKQVIDRCPLEDAKEFLQVAFSSVIVNVSYQDSDTRYVRREKGIGRGDTLRRWLSKVDDMLEHVRECDSISPLGKVQTITMDSRQFSGVEPESIALAVTSPPYPNAYSYHLYHQHRMLWLGFDQPRFKREEIGSHRKYSAKQNGATAGTFLSEMTTVLRAVSATLRPSALCVLVVGDSIVRGEVIRNDCIVLSAGQEVGLRHLITLKRRIHTGKKSFNPTIGSIREEHLVFLRQP